MLICLWEGFKKVNADLFIFIRVGNWNMQSGDHG